MRLPQQVLRVLIIGSLETDSLQIFQQLGAFNSSLYVEGATSALELKGKLESSWNLVLFKSHVTYMTSIDALSLVKNRDPALPFVLISTGVGEEETAQLMKAGADDIVCQTRLNRLSDVFAMVLELAKHKEEELFKARTLTSIQTLDARPKILVIDDDDDLRAVICWALDQEGYCVHSYADPTVALTRLREGDHIPQMIVIDFQMESMNGTEFLKLKNMIERPGLAACPVVMISASPEDIDPDERQTLVDKFMIKPLDLEALMINVKKLIAS